MKSKLAKICAHEVVIIYFLYELASEPFNVNLLYASHYTLYSNGKFDNSG